MTKKYVTTKVKNGLDYRSIAEIMTKCGDEMNHSTVRNIITRGLVKVVKGISKEYELEYTDKKIKEIAQSPEFQESIMQIMKGKQ